MAEPVIVTSAMLSALALAGGYAGVTFNDTDLPNLGKLFYEYTNKVNMTWDAVKVAFSTGLAFNKATQELALDSNLANLLRGFFDDAIPGDLTTGSYLNMCYCGIPVLIDDTFIINELIPNKTPYGVRCDIPLGSALKIAGTSFPVGSARLEYVGHTDTIQAMAWYKLKGGQIKQKASRGYSHSKSAEGQIVHNWFYITYVNKVNGRFLLHSCTYVENPKTGEGIENLEHVCLTSYGNSYADYLDIPDLFPVPVNGKYVGENLGEKDTPIVIPGTIPGVNVKVEDGVITLPDTMTDNPGITIDKDVVIDVPGVVPETPEIPLPPIINIPGGEDNPIDEGEDGTLEDKDKETWSPQTNEVSGGLYYYYIGTDVSDNRIDDVIGHATGVVSLSYTPYLWYNDLNISKIIYDSERFNNVSKFSNFYVYRINDITRPIRKIGGFEKYANDFKVNIGADKPYNYMNETKLYQYPYSFAYLYDGINQPLEIKYHYLKYQYNDVYVKQTVSDKCTYGLFVKGYKGDNNGYLESMVLTSGNELPCSSSTYAQWFATNRNQQAQAIQNIQNSNAIANHGAMTQLEYQQNNHLINNIGSLVGALGSVFSLDFGQAVGSVTNVFTSQNTMKAQISAVENTIAMNRQNEQNAIQSALALNSDMRNSPSTLISHGSNVFYGITNNNKKLLLIRMGLNEEDYYRLGTYFTMFGYKQNKVLSINLRNRKYFNYFKILNPNIVSNTVPSSHLDKICEIFKNGITLWHYNNSDKILDYFHSDNYEV